MNIIFMGTPQFAAPTLQALVKDSQYNITVITQPDRPAKRGYRLTPPVIKLLAQRLNIPVYQPFSLSKPEDVELIKRLAPELIVVVAFGQILSDDVINIPKYGCINLHPSLLPKYRGAAPIQWSIINGDKVTGVTVAYVSSKLDAGDIILQKEVNIEPFDTAGSLSDKLSQIGAELVIESIKKIVDGTASRIPQDEAKATYTSRIKKEDALINWHRPAVEIFNLIRALNPAPGAYTYTPNNQRLKIWMTEIVDTPTTHHGQKQEVPPGTIIELTKRGPVIATATDNLLLLEVQPPGKKKMTGFQYLHGHRWETGLKLRSK
jgi:methionyl-tRNA formyltransferase